MSDRGDEGNGDLFGPDRSDRDELWGPPRQSEDPGTGERPSSGVGDEPTRMMPGGPGGPGAAGGSEPTSVMPPVGGGPFGPGYPPDDPRHPGAPGGPAGPGGPGGPVGPDDPEFDEFGEDDVPWYRQPGPLAAAIAGAIALILGIIALAVLAGDDDGDEITDASTTSTSSSTTVAPTVSAVAPTTVPPTQPPTTPPPTEPPTTLPATTTTSSTTTTSTTTTTTTTTTTPPTTAPPTTEEPERPTTTSPREPTTTVAIPDQPTAWDYIIRAPELGQLEGYVRQAGMIDIFERPGITVLAPIDQAFTDMASYEDGAALLGDDARLAELLQRHVLVEALTAEDILDRDSLTTVGGDSLAVDGGTIEGASIVSPDHESGDGSLVQMVDPVLVGDLLGG